MCTVTYLPIKGGGFIITSNRDERKARPTLPPQAYNINNQNIYFPKDQEAGGTWFAASPNYTVVLLNGAEHKHHYQPPYRKSRGLIMLDFFSYTSPQSYAQQHNFEGIEPFTLVIANKQKHTLHQFRWDEKHAVLVEKESAQPHIWSSATLYDEETRKQRVVWFDAWLKDNKEFTVDNILHFHHFGGTGNIQNDLVMDRDGRVQTVSITSVEYQGENPVLYYEDIVNQKLYTTPLST